MKSTARTQKARGLTRIEIPEKHTFGWMMRIRRGRNSIHEWFSDTKFGGKKKAKLAALQRYRKLDAKLPAAVTSHKGQKTRRNSSGKVGVYFKKNIKGGKTKDEYYACVAFWLAPDGGKKSISFAVEKYGHTKAWKMACHARENETTDKKTIESRFGFNR